MAFNIDAESPTTPLLTTDRIGLARGATPICATLSTLQSLLCSRVDNEVLASDFALTTGSYEATGIEVDIPAAGNWRISCDIRYSLLMTSGSGYLKAKLYDVTNGADIANSERFLAFSNNTVLFAGTAPLNQWLTTAGAVQVALYAARIDAGSASFNTSLIASDSNGRTTIDLYRG